MSELWKGNQALLDSLRREGVRDIFGNPGYTEIPWLDILSGYPEIEYVLTLHEDIAVGMADGYALASGRPGVASVHTTPGTTHGLGNLYNAAVSGTPLVVLAGQQESKLLIRDPFLASDLLRFTRQFVKWSWEVTRADEIPLAIHRAFKVATDPPTGPTLVSIPRDLYDQPCAPTAPVPSRDLVARRIGPDPDAIGRAARLLREAERPAILCGPGAHRSGAIPLVSALAEKLAMRVYDDIRFPASFPTTHPLYLGLFHPEVAAQADVLLVVGQKAFLERNADQIPVIPSTTRLVHIDADPWEIAKLYPVEVGIIGDPSLCLDALLAAIGTMAGREDPLKRRRDEIARDRAAWEEERAGELRACWDRVPISAQRLSRELREALPPDGILVVEATTTHAHLRRFFDLPAPGLFFHGVGGSLGWGVPAALGVKLAKPRQPVVAVVGDGSFLYYPQALWTAARYGIQIVVVIANNRSYLNDRLHLQHRKGPAFARGDYSSVDLTSPEIDYVRCAESMGVSSHRVERPEELGPALKRLLSLEQPALLDVAIDPWQGGEKVV
jgi:benzoylformate decarboxylase